MKTVFIILASAVVVWWFVNPASGRLKFVGGFIGDIIGYFQFLTGQPIIGNP